MLQRIILVILIILSPNFIFAQDNIQREYKISMIGLPQTIYLIEHTKDEYTGYIISDFYKPLKKFLFLTLRKHKKIKIKEDLASHIVKKAMQELKLNGIEQLKKCKEDEECKEIIFLDPDHLVFEITSGNKKIRSEFQSVYPEKIEKTNIEHTKLRRQAQILITTLDEVLDLEEIFHKTSQKIKRPYCYYCGGISSCCPR